jgi:aminoglycoside 6'-N-acetyltransferase
MTPTPAEAQLSFRPMALDDLPLFQRWMAEPHVARWWNGGAETAEAVEAKYLERVSGDHHVTPWIAEADGTPFGFVQWYRVADEAEWFPDMEIPEATPAIDLAIGEPEFLGRGLGKRMVLEFLHHVLRPAAPDCTEVWIDPDPTNERAVRTYAAAGFHDTGVDLPNPDNPTAVRRLMRMTWAGPTFR